jgi:hypothetical protein
LSKKTAEFETPVPSRGFSFSSRKSAYQEDGDQAGWLLRELYYCPRDRISAP